MKHVSEHEEPIAQDWSNLIASYWCLSVTFWHLSISDMKSLGAVDKRLRASVDLFVRSMPGTIESTIGTEAFAVVGSFLSMDEFCILNAVSKGCRFSVRQYSTSFSRDVRALVRSWCEDKRAAMLMHSLECYQNSRPDFVLYHPPFLQVDLGSLAFDGGRMKLVGQPLKEVQVNSSQPRNLGRREPFVCTIDDDRSLIFYCGGRSFVEVDRDDPWTWLSRAHVVTSQLSMACGVFNTKTGLWKALQDMPDSRAGGAACRIGKHVLLFGGIDQESIETIHRTPHFVLVFDLDEERWVGDHGIKSFPGAHPQECQAAVASGDNVVIISRRQVFTLSSSGMWTQFPSIPVLVGSVICCHIIECYQQRPRLLAVGKNSWATLAVSREEEVIPRGEWVMSPDVRDFGLPRISLFYGNSLRVFSGYSWKEMECHPVSHQTTHNVLLH